MRRIRKSTKLAVCLGSLGLLGVLLLPAPMAVAQELYSGDGSDATEGGSHQVIVTQVDGIECVKTTFEGGGQRNSIHPGNTIPGTAMRFPGWESLTSGNYANNPTVPTIAFWISGGASRDITFDDPCSSVSFFYASFPNVTLQAFDVANNQVASVVGPSNFTNTFNVWDPLGVDVGENIITRVRITGNNNQTAIDDFECCRIVCEPGAEICDVDDDEIEVLLPPGVAPGDVVGGRITMLDGVPVNIPAVAIDDDCDCDDDNGDDEESPCVELEFDEFDLPFDLDEAIEVCVELDLADGTMTCETCFVGADDDDDDDDDD